MNNHSNRLNEFISSHFDSQVKEPNIKKIIYSAMEVFSKKSVEATKIKDIAAHAGFSQGYIYNYFSSKEDLFTRIIELAADGGPKSIAFADSMELSAFEKLCTLASVMTDLDSLSVQHFRLILMLVSNPDSVPAKAKEVYATSARYSIEALSKIIYDGQKNGEIAAGNPVTLCITFFSLVHGLLLLKLQAKETSLFPTPQDLLKFLLK